MPHPSEWDNKPKAMCYPYRVNSSRVCQNCFQGWGIEHINPCTGLCPNCNFVNSEEPILPSRRIATIQQGVTCEKCRVRVVSNTNIGISRRICEFCLRKPEMIQRCLWCNAYKRACWNNICPGCRYGTYLCENTGEVFRNSDHHWLQCWCLPHPKRCLRDEQNRNHTVAAGLNIETIMIPAPKEN